MAELTDKYITRQQILKLIGQAAYDRAVSGKKFRVYKFSPESNAKQYVKIKEFEAFVESCAVEQS